MAKESTIRNYRLTAEDDRRIEVVRRDLARTGHGSTATDAIRVALYEAAERRTKKEGIA